MIMALELIGWFLFLGLLITIRAFLSWFIIYGGSSHFTVAYLLLIISFGSTANINTPGFKCEIQRPAMTFMGSPYRLVVDVISRMNGYHRLRVVL
jgi:hypothetical protein